MDSLNDVMKIYLNYIATTDGSNIREGEVGPDDKKKYDINEIIPFIPKKFEDDISRLKARIGNDKFLRGLQIEVSLAELYEICPHNRMRSDTYEPLVNFLQEELEISLKISNKRYGSVKNTVW